MSLFLQSDNTIDVMVLNELRLTDDVLTDWQLFFGPTNEKPLYTCSTNMGEVLLELGLIDSKGWARKNGWWREIEPGFQCFTFGKNKIKIYVYKMIPFGEDDDKV